MSLPEESTKGRGGSGPSRGCHFPDTVPCLSSVNFCVSGVWYVGVSVVDAAVPGGLSRTAGCSPVGVGERGLWVAGYCFSGGGARGGCLECRGAEQITARERLRWWLSGPDRSGWGSPGWCGGRVTKCKAGGHCGLIGAEEKEGRTEDVLGTAGDAKREGAGDAVGVGGGIGCKLEFEDDGDG